MRVEYKGYKAVTYGESSLTVYDDTGKECLHTGSRSKKAETEEGLKSIIDAIIADFDISGE